MHAGVRLPSSEDEGEQNDTCRIKMLEEGVLQKHHLANDLSISHFGIVEAYVVSVEFSAKGLDVIIFHKFK